MGEVDQQQEIEGVVMVMDGDDDGVMVKEARGKKRRGGELELVDMGREREAPALRLGTKLEEKEPEGGASRPGLAGLASRELKGEACFLCEEDEEEET